MYSLHTLFPGQEETLDIIVPYQIRKVGVDNKESTTCFAIEDFDKLPSILLKKVFAFCLRFWILHRDMDI
jgi:hypothetical protein